MSNFVTIDIISTLVGWIIGSLSFWLVLKWHEPQVKKSHPYTLKTDIEHEEFLHWNPLEKRRGLGDLLKKVNHIAITVSDVGKSISFYVDVLGLQQIRRPTFDRHGAWLTMGNIELHLIKGIPATPPVDNIQVAHIALETSDIEEALRKLRQLNIEVRQSVLLTNAQQSLTNEPQSKILQYFFTDPDGYFLELCNCDVLTEFAFNRKHTMDDIEYDEGIPNNIKSDITEAVAHWKEAVEKHQSEELDDVLANITPATEIDKDKFDNLVQRRTVYGDIMQGFSDDEIKEALLRTNNLISLTIKLLTKKRGEKKFFQPVAFIENGHLTKPEPFVMNQNNSD